MLGLLLFKRAYSLASNNATLTTKATTFPSSSLVHYLPYKTFSKPTTQNQVLIKTNPFHHPLRPLISSQPSLAVAGKKLLILDYFRVWTFLRAQVNPKPGAKLHYTIGLPWNQWYAVQFLLFVLILFILKQFICTVDHLEKFFKNIFNPSFN